MTPAKQRELLYAPELAVVLALCATAEAARGALDAIHRTDCPDLPTSREQLLARRLCNAIRRLTGIANIYRDYVADLAAPASAVVDDFPF